MTDSPLSLFSLGCFSGSLEDRQDRRFNMRLWMSVAEWKSVLELHGLFTHYILLTNLLLCIPFLSLLTSAAWAFGTDSSLCFLFSVPSLVSLLKIVWDTDFDFFPSYILL